MAAGNIWKALQRNDNLTPVASMISSFVQEAKDRERKKKIFDLLSGAKNQINQGFEPTANPEYQSRFNTQINDLFINANPQRKQIGLNALANTEPTQVDYDAGTKNAKNVLSDLLLNSIGDENLKPEDLVQGIEALKLGIPDKPKEPTMFDLSEGQQKWMVDPKTKQLKLIAENKKDVKPGEQFKNFSEKGYWDTTDPTNPVWKANKDYKEKPTVINNNISIPDNSVQEGKTISAIKLMQDIKNAKPNEDGSFTVPSHTGSGLKNFKSYEDLTKYKEQVKASFIEPVIQTIKQQGLVPAKDNVKKDIEELKSKMGLKPEDTPTPKMLELTIRKMKVDNPQLDDEQIDIIRSYFTFFYQ